MIPQRWRNVKAAAAIIAALCMTNTAFADMRSSSSRLGVSDYKLSVDSISAVNINDVEVIVELITNGTNDTLPVDIAYILDESTSMRRQDRMTNAKIATKNVIDHMNLANGDRGAIVTFGTSGLLRQAYTSNDSLLHNAVNQIEANSSSTNFGTGLQTALTLGESANPEYFIFLSDGKNGGADYSAMLETAKDEGIKIFTVGLGSGEFFDSLALKNIAAETYGKYYHVPISDSLPSIFKILYEFINNQVVTDIRYDAYPNSAEFGNFAPDEPLDPAKWSDITDGKRCEYGSLPAQDLKEIRFKLSELLPDNVTTGEYTVMKSGLISYKDRIGVERTIELDSLNINVVGDTIPEDSSQIMVKSANMNTYNGYKAYNAQIELYNLDSTSATGFGAPIPMRELTVRYWYDRDVEGSVDESTVEFYDNWETDEIHVQDNAFAGSSIVSVVKNEADSYVELRFSAAAGTFNQKVCVQFQVNKVSGDWDDKFELTNDYSYNGESTYKVNKNITVYRNSTLIAGNEPN